MSRDDQALGPLEMRVLGLLAGAEPTSVQDIQAALARGGHDLAYTTVMTVLARLHDKGMVVRVKEGRRYLYRPAARSRAASCRASRARSSRATARGPSSRCSTTTPSRRRTSAPSAARSTSGSGASHERGRAGSVQPAAERRGLVRDRVGVRVGGDDAV